MMKKITLLFAIAAVSALSTSAQLLNCGSSRQAARANPTATPLVYGAAKTAKTTAGGFRTYNHANYSESITSSAFNGSSLAIWQDSTIREEFSSGLAAINFSSVAQSFYPFDALWNDATNPAFAGLLAITKTIAYKVDSVSIFGFYIQGNSPSASAKPDSLEITVASQPADNTFYWRGSTDSWAIPYLPSGKDTLFTSSPYNVDSVRRQALSNPLATALVKFKVALNPSDRKAIDTATIFTEFKYKLPTALSVPAGNNVLVSYTFRTGDTWVANIDTITQKHHFRAGFAYEGTAAVSDKQAYRWYQGDRSMSSIMFSTDPSFYTPTVIIGALNTPSQWFNQYLLNSITVSKTTSIQETTFVTGFSVYPNPGNEKVRIEFSIQEKADVLISLSNMMGQVVASKNMGAMVSGQKESETFTTSELPSGVYFCTIEVNGVCTTNRFEVAH